MGRIVAIDYGKKRTGIAVSDPMKMIANGLTTVPSVEVVRFLKDYIKKEKVDLFLLGEPRQMDYSPSENMERVILFREKLKISIPEIPIQMADERFTSVLAQKAIREAGLKKKDRQNKELIDEMSATILLQTYLIIAF